MNDETKERIEKRIRSKMDTIIKRRIKSLSSDIRNLNDSNPFGSRLVPLEIWKASKFERSFVTSFGQGVYEQIAYEIARGSGASAENQHMETVALNTWQEEAINDLLAKQRSEDCHVEPDWDTELTEILEYNSPRHLEIKICFDLYVKRENGSEE